MRRTAVKVMTGIGIVVTLLSSMSAFAAQGKIFEFPLQNKTVVMGSDLSAIKANFPDVKKTKYSYEKSIDQIITASFKFNKSKLHEVSVSNDIQLDGSVAKDNAIENLSNWIVKTHGNGKIIKKKNEYGEMLINWTIGDILISKEAFLGADGAGLITYIIIKQK